MTYDPERWLETCVREIKDYALSGFNDTYDVVMEFPGPAMDRSDMPLSKTVVHFEIDDMLERELGLGLNVFADNYDEATKTSNPQYARMHVLNFDVGIWASAKSGGITSRMRAKQVLEELFGSTPGQLKLREISDGGDGCVEIISFTGGRFIVDTINDVPIYRMIDGTLTVRVYSRTKLSDTPGPTIEEIDQAPNLTILG